MTETKNFKLKKPEYNDPADIQVLNDNFDIIDEHLGTGSGSGLVQYIIDLSEKVSLKEEDFSKYGIDVSSLVDAAAVLAAKEKGSQIVLKLQKGDTAGEYVFVPLEYHGIENVARGVNHYFGGAACVFWKSLSLIRFMVNPDAPLTATVFIRSVPTDAIVRTVNGVEPDVNGNVVVSAGPNMVVSVAPNETTNNFKFTHGKLSADGSLLEATNRAISQEIPCTANECVVQTSGYSFWVHKFDADGAFLGLTDIKGATSSGFFTVDTTDCAYIRLQIANTDDSDILSEDLALANENKYFIYPHYIADSDELGALTRGEYRIHPCFIQAFRVDSGFSNEGYAHFRNLSRFLYLKTGDAVRISPNGDKALISSFDLSKTFKTDIVSWQTSEFIYTATEDEYIRVACGNTDDGIYPITENKVSITKISHHATETQNLSESVTEMEVTVKELQNTVENLIPITDVTMTSADFEKGKYGATGKLDDNTVMRIKEPVKVSKGNSVTIAGGESGLMYYGIFYPEADGEPNFAAWVNVLGWATSATYEFSENGYFALQYINSGRTEAVSASDYDGHITIYRNSESGIDLQKYAFTQISDPFKMTSASAVRAAYDASCGLVGCAYMGGWLVYGENHRKTILTIFSVSNPNEKKHITVYEDMCYEVNVILLAPRIWRVIICKGANGYVYRDYNLDTNTLSDPQEMYAVIGGQNVEISAQNRANYTGDILGENEYMTTLTSSMFNDTDGKYYGCWCNEDGKPILFYSTDSMATIVPFAVFPNSGNYEASFVKRNGTLLLIHRGGNCIGTSRDNGASWEIKSRSGDSNRPSVYLVGNNVIWLHGVSERKTITINFGDDFFNPDKTLVVKSEWGCVYAELILVNDSLYMLYSDSQLAMDVSSGINWQGKDNVKFVKLLDNVFD